MAKFSVILISHTAITGACEKVAGDLGLDGGFRR